MAAVFNTLVLILYAFISIIGFGYAYLRMSVLAASRKNGIAS